MNKKTIIWIITGVLAIVLIVGVSVFVNKNKNEAEKETDDLEKERTIDVKDAKGELEEFKKEEDFLTREEISDEINKYKSKEGGEDLDDWEIKEKLKEDYGIEVATSFEEGTMIGKDMEDYDAKQVMIENLRSEPLGIRPIKKIVNPISNEFGNSGEDRNSSITEIKVDTYEGGNYYTKDTDGFKNIEGLNIGYPMVDRAEGGEVTISLSLLIDEDVKSKDIDDFLKQYEKVEVNGHKLTEDELIYAEDSVYNETKEDLDFTFEDRDIALFKDSVLEVQINVPMEDVFKGIEEYDDKMSRYKENNEEDDAVEEDLIEALWEDMLDEKPVITVNETEWELSEEVRVGDAINDEGNIEYDVEGDYLIKPEIYGE